MSNGHRVPVVAVTAAAAGDHFGDVDGNVSCDLNSTVVHRGAGVVGGEADLVQGGHVEEGRTAEDEEENHVSGDDLAAGEGSIVEMMIQQSRDRIKQQQLESQQQQQQQRRTDLHPSAPPPTHHKPHAPSFKLPGHVDTPIHPPSPAPSPHLLRIASHLDSVCDCLQLSSFICVGRCLFLILVFLTWLLLLLTCKKLMTCTLQIRQHGGWLGALSAANGRLLDAGDVPVTGGALPINGFSHYLPAAARENAQPKRLTRTHPLPSRCAPPLPISLLPS